jgi:hypothetical protein
MFQAHPCRRRERGAPREAIVFFTCNDLMRDREIETVERAVT